jgi:hypothetical protein
MLHEADEKLTVGHVLPPHWSDNVTVAVLILSFEPAALLSNF